MEILHDYLPKDLINIVEEYSRDRSSYDRVVYELIDTKVTPIIRERITLDKILMASFAELL